MKGIERRKTQWIVIKGVKEYRSHCQRADQHVRIGLWLETVSRAKCWYSLWGYLVLILQETKWTRGTYPKWMRPPLSFHPVALFLSLKGPYKLGWNFAIFILQSKAFFIMSFNLGLKMVKLRQPQQYIFLVGRIGHQQTEIKLIRRERFGSQWLQFSR